MSVLTPLITRLPQPYRTLTDAIIPAVPGEFYAYPTEISHAKSLQIFCKCKSNKGRMLSDLATLGEENALFWDIASQQVLSVKEALRQSKIVADVPHKDVGDTWIAHTDLKSKQFYDIAEQRSVQALKQECLRAFAAQPRKVEMMKVDQGQTVAVMTSQGKYALMFVVDMSDSVQIDACHALLD